MVILLFRRSLFSTAKVCENVYVSTSSDPKWLGHEQKIWQNRKKFVEAVEGVSLRCKSFCSMVQSYEYSKRTCMNIKMHYIQQTRKKAKKMENSLLLPHFIWYFFVIFSLLPLIQNCVEFAGLAILFFLPFVLLLLFHLWISSRFAYFVCVRMYFCHRVCVFACTPSYITEPSNELFSVREIAARSATTEGAAAATIANKLNCLLLTPLIFECGVLNTHTTIRQRMQRK